MLINVTKLFVTIVFDIFKTPGFDDFEEPSLWVAICTYFSYAVLLIYGHVNDFLTKIGLLSDELHAKENGNAGFVPLYSDFEDFFTRHMYRRIRDCYNRPVTNVPGGRVDCLNRTADPLNVKFDFNDEYRNCLNLGSYNYLGFAQNEGPCADAAVETLKEYGMTTASPMMEFGMFIL
eukprot:Pgem_evm1s5512